MIVFMKNCFLLIAIASFLLGCSGNKKENTLQDEEGTPVINLSSDNVSKVALLPLSEAAAKVEIVSLEVTDESLIGEITKMKVTDSDIWVKHYKDNHVLRFSRSGKFLNKVGKVGQGPEEYIRMADFFVDENTKEVYIQTTIVGVKDNHVLRFSRSGKFLNKVGKVGQGPEEYIRMADFFVDENTKEVYIQTTIVGVKVYDYEGNYKRTAAKTSPDDVFMTMYFQFALYDNKFFIAQNLAFINKPTPKDSVWSFAWVDSTYQKKKIFKNPAHIGREEEIMKNGINFQQFVNYWLEPFTSIDTYGNQLTLKYPDTDTIYRYDSPANELVPQYIISTHEEKGDYGATHVWFRERSAFDYFSIYSYYPSKDNIYLLCSKGETIYTYCYGKQTGKVKVKERKSEITERMLGNHTLRRLEGAKYFILDNDLCGGSFHVDYRSQGKYWIDVLIPNSEDNWIDIDEMRTSDVKDESLKAKFIHTLENVEEESNPILVIATLK